MRVLYVHGDDAGRGLEHGRHYHIQKETLKSGRIRVIVEENGCKFTFKNEFEFVKYFLPGEKPKRGRDGK